MVLDMGLVLCGFLSLMGSSPGGKAKDEPPDAVPILKTQGALVFKLACLPS